MAGKSEILPQIIAVFCACVGGAGLGTIVGYASPAGIILTDTNGIYNSTVTITDNQNSWVSSVSNVGAVIAAPLTGFCVAKFGRRKTVIFSVIPVTIGWVLIITAQGFAMLLLGRIISGMYCSLSSVSVPGYVGEISSPHIRGMLGSVFQFMIVTGILFAYAMGAAFDSFRWIAGMCALIPALCSVLMIFQPESPYYLLMKGREREAEEALIYFRGQSYDGIESEMKMLRETIAKSTAKKSKISDLMLPYNRKPFLMAMGLFFFQQFVGIGAVLFNMALIFKSVGSTMEESTSSVIVGVVQVLATGAGVLLVDISGRRMLLGFSAIGMIISHVGLGIYFYYLDTGANAAENIGWLPLVALILYIIAFNVGYGPVPWLMAGELFNSDVKEISASIATMCNWTFAFIITATFEPLQNAIKEYGAYWLFAIFCVLSLLFCIFLVYETKGKTLQEINEHFGYPQSEPEGEKVNGFEKGENGNNDLKKKERSNSDFKNEKKDNNDLKKEYAMI